jgi:acyl-coenzyme A thioesterase 13
MLIGMLPRLGRRVFSSSTRTIVEDGFMAAIRSRGLAGVIGQFPVGLGGRRFDSALHSMEVVSVSKGKVAATLTVTEELSNSYGTLHGGAAALIIDVAGTLAALSVDPTRPGVTTDMTQSFLRAAKIGDKIYITGVCEKSGQRLAYTSVTINSGGFDGPLLVAGRHTKCL